MFHPHAEAARVRMFAKLGVRLIVVLLVLAYLRDVYAGVLFFSPVAQWRVWLYAGPAWDAMWRGSPWLIGAASLLIVQRPLIRWLVPVPRAGCVNCGYAMSTSQQVCPECGLKPERNMTARDNAGETPT